MSAMPLRVAQVDAILAFLAETAEMPDAVQAALRIAEAVPLPGDPALSSFITALISVVVEQPGRRFPARPKAAPEAACV